MRRRQAIAVTGSLFGIGVTGCLTASEPKGSGNEPSTGTIAEGTWPQVNYDAQNSRYVPDATGPRDDAVIKWTALGDRTVYPPIVGENLYFTESWTDGTAFSLSPIHGEEGWSNNNLPPMRWGPALYDGLLLVISREEGNTIRLHALNTKSGEQEWVREEGITASSGQYPLTGPTVYQDMVYIASNRGVISCDAATGETRWAATLGKHVVETDKGPTWETDWAKPAVTDDYVYTFDTNDHYKSTRELYAIDRVSGEQTWTATLEVEEGWYLIGHVVAGQRRVFVTGIDPSVGGTGTTPTSGAARLFAINTASGSVDWTWNRSGRVLSQPTYADGDLFVGAVNPRDGDHQLLAIDAADGTAIWTFEVSDSNYPPTIAYDTVYLSHGQQLTALARENGEQRWSLEIGENAGVPVIVGNTVYLLTEPGRDKPSDLLAVSAP